MKWRDVIHWESQSLPKLGRPPTLTSEMDLRSYEHISEMQELGVWTYSIASSSCDMQS
jgi:hypothetical protein